MIITEYYMTRPDGVKLERTYSDADVMIRNTATGAEYAEVINPENSGRQYAVMYVSRIFWTSYSISTEV